MLGFHSVLMQATDVLCVCVLAGVREVVLCKDQKGKCGVSLFSVSKGVFVCFVGKGTPASMAGLRFGDQILSVSVCVCMWMFGTVQLSVYSWCLATCKHTCVEMHVVTIPFPSL